MVGRVEYVFGPPRSCHGHSLGVTALALDPISHSLYSGGRDGRLCGWRHTDKGAEAISTIDQHTNSISAILWWKNRLFSCSSDTTVKMWDPAASHSSAATTTIGHHLDYVQCLTTENDHLVSGGLDSRVIGWDPVSCKEAYKFTSPCSLYAVVGAANCVVTGGQDAIIRLWDPRSGENIVKLTGHTDTVRGFLLEDDWLVSASSDSSLKLWSLTAGRALRTWTHHSDSIWSLEGSPSHFWSGDRAGNVWEMVNNEPKPLFTDFRGVKALVHDPSHSQLWTAANTHPEIHCWSQSPQKPDLWSLSFSTEGHPGLRKHRLLNDKRRALVVSTDGKVNMVDLVRAESLGFERKLPAEALESSKQIDDALEEILEEVNTMDVLNNWCQVSIKAGQVCVILDGLSLCNTEVYADELGVEKVQTPAQRENSELSNSDSKGDSNVIDPEKRLFIGSLVLRNLLRPVVSDLAQRYNEATTEVHRPKAHVVATQSEQVSDVNGESTRKKLFNKFLRRKGKEDPVKDGDATSSTNGDTAAAGAASAGASSPNLKGTRHDSEASYSDPTQSRNQDLDENSKSSEHQNTTGSQGQALDSADENESHSQSQSQSRNNSQGSNQAQSNGQSQDQPSSQDDHNKIPTTFEEAWDRGVQNKSFNFEIDELYPLKINSNTQIIVTDMPAGAGAATELWQGTISSLEKDPKTIQKVLPGWVGEALITGKLPSRGPTSVGFSLTPLKSDMFGDKTIPGVITGQIRLVATSMLRVRKIMAYTLSQLQTQGVLPKVDENGDELIPENVIQINCQDTVLTPRLTLATIRTRLWRQGGDVALTYSISASYRGPIE